MNRKMVRQVAIPVAIVLCVVSVWWPAIQTVATILLLLVAFEYVLLTQENIELFRRQLQRQENVYVNFELIFRNGLVVRVANLGISNFLAIQDRKLFNLEQPQNLACQKKSVRSAL